MMRAANPNQEVCMMAQATEVLEPLAIAPITLGPPDDLPAFPPEPPGRMPPPPPPMDPDEAPETPPDEPPPIPVSDPPAQPDPAPMVVRLGL
jgi:hypothetical protein